LEESDNFYSYFNYEILTKTVCIVRIIKIRILILFVILCYPFTQGKAEEQKRAMTLLDIIQMRSLGGWDIDISPDGKWFIYTISIPD